MSEYVMFTEELLRNFYDPTTCSYMVPLSGKAAHDMGVLRQENAELKTENTKLRKLVRGLNWCTESPDGPRVDCERCPLGVVNGEPLELMCEKMMHELGIEV